MTSRIEQHRHYQTIAAAIAYINTHQAEQPSLAAVARAVHKSPDYLQRIFKQWAGLSPKQFLQFLTWQRARLLLLDQTVEAAADAAGLSSSSRLHDLLLNWQAVTPGEYRSGGVGVTISYGSGATPFGYALAGLTRRGICWFTFFDTAAEYRQQLAELFASWPGATLQADNANAEALLNHLFCHNRRQPLSLLLKGTPFQLKVWEALLSIPAGRLCSYQQLAQQLGQPAASRAVASAVARNAIGWLIPCHRVIRSTGAFSNYRWGVLRKQAMLAAEYPASRATDNLPS